jgi:UDP-3-O-[3-hydroxymyristoyl] glucosamine N-acyltransferase
MKLKEPIRVAEIAALIDAKLIGDPDLLILHLNEIHKVCRGSLVMVADDRYLNQALYSSAAAVILREEVEQPLQNKALLIVEDPFAAYNYLAKHFAPFRPLSIQIHPSAKIGANTVLEPGVVLGEEVEIGEDCLIRANVVILDRVKIGNRVTIHPNTTVGSAGFYFHKEAKQEAYQRWHPIGDVFIEDDVEIGAGCTIDRGISGITRIGQGTKIDNQVHVGHGVVIGKHCLIAAQVGIAGKVTIQDYVVIFGQVGISKEVVIGENAILLSQTGVSKSIPGDMQYFGTPAVEARTSFRELAALRRLPDMLKWWLEHIKGQEDEVAD